MKPLVLAAVLAGSCALGAAAAAPPPLVIHGEFDVAGLRAHDGSQSLARARVVFGRPARLVRRGERCTGSWPALGLMLSFWHAAPTDPCARGELLTATASGPRWRTDDGLAIGDPISRLRHLYPQARLHTGSRWGSPPGWWLIPCSERSSQAPPFTSLVAIVRSGRVASFWIFVLPGGDYGCG